MDLLNAIGLKPDGVVGHSVGELGCAYADGCLTAEETVLAAYWRGRCVLDGNLPPGGMAAVGKKKKVYVGNLIMVRTSNVHPNKINLMVMVPLVIIIFYYICLLIICRCKYV